MSHNFMQAVKERRSIYGLSKEQVVSADRIQEIVDDAVKYAPSAFNSQSARVVVLLGGQSDKLWDITRETLRKIVPAEQFASTEDRINNFSAGYGTILFFEDQMVVETLQNQFTSYADNFPIWSNQSSGMLQFIVWTALEQEGLGASLQHYNPIIDDEVRATWELPTSWKLIAQMPFGKPTAQPGGKDINPLSDRVKIFQ
ncbi:nitroreductase family protein [Paenibacillus harenae]|uniref:Oxidoreductase (Fatty acid repression mutant protein) n=1 Tax=Paenibacillus harenae TaxID=306543 RepID=A0ABT9U3G1_PAEHA|nr:nitroreductase family protein [Paenibacillus harenae]MDQ0113528.1 putative oxidoreductase (fatty acid repression mutant protein) [Paenibacillus harenae]